MRAVLFLAALTLTTTAPFAIHAQWTLQDSRTTADLRGIDNVGGGVAWASGTNGTVLRTEDAGFEWQVCTIPPGADHLDFRGIQAFDNNTAIVMSSGPGDQSRLYKTTDGCQSWHLLFTNPDKDGFWDALKFVHQPVPRFDGKVIRIGAIIGDPVEGVFAEFDSNDNGEHWAKASGPFFPAKANDGEALFAASNSSLLLTDHNGRIFVTGGTSGSRSRILSEYVKHDPQVSVKFIGGDIPLATGESAGAFSIATSYIANDADEAAANKGYTVIFFPRSATCVVVGGDYRKPDRSTGTAAWSIDGGQHWHLATTPPHGYRSAVAYDAPTRTWITVGPNGTDISTDDGRHWRPLHPSNHDAPDADRNWNALSLPYAVGPHGRIGILNPSALTAPQPQPAAAPSALALAPAPHNSPAHSPSAAQTPETPPSPAATSPNNSSATPPASPAQPPGSP
jgi:photosystem II stability/assembly factor-like uncharacterized protein